MNTNHKNETHAADEQGTFARICNACLRSLEKAKSSVLADFRGNVEEHEHLLKLAVNEAEALAWETGFPQLVFPTLAAEKATAVAAWHTRQHSLLAAR